MSASTDPSTLTRKDFATDQDVRWCPGCGDYSILAAVQKVMPELGIPKEDFAIVSGIGCSSRFPYYMNTYGFHSIHGRAFAVATGLKAANKDLSVWVVTGDGDACSIGGNHLIHILRRNVNVNILLFNNQIYGLTKGQYSPTSETGKKTKSSPFGSLDNPVTPLKLALGAEASWVARTIDRDPKHMVETFKRAAAHNGTSLVEIYQNCNIFNDGAYESMTDKKTKLDNVLSLEHGKPLLFAGGEKCVVQDGFSLKVANTADVAENAIVVHDEQADAGYHFQIAALGREGGPSAFGVIRNSERPSYDDLLFGQSEAIRDRFGAGNLQELVAGNNTWTVE